MMNVNQLTQHIPAIQLSGESTFENRQTMNRQVDKSNEHVEYINPDEFKRELNNLNQTAGANFANLKFVFHEDLHEYYVTVVDSKTDEVIREIPPKKMLDMYAAMTKNRGVVIDSKI